MTTYQVNQENRFWYALDEFNNLYCNFKKYGKQFYVKLTMIYFSLTFLHIYRILTKNSISKAIYSRWEIIV